MKITETFEKAQNFFAGELSGSADVPPTQKSNKDNLTLTDIRLYQKATIFKIVWKWKNVSVGENGVFRYGSNTYTYVCMWHICIYINLIFGKVSFLKQRERQELFNKKCREN